MEIVKLRPYEDQLPAINYHKGQIKTLERRVKGRATRLARMKEKLAEFRTMTFPGMEHIMTPNTIVRWISPNVQGIEMIANSLMRMDGER